jgi:sarcosine oxidase, subunit gamma
VHDLSPLTALGGTAPLQDRIGPVTLTESPDWALASVAARLGQEEGCRAALAAALGGAAPAIAAHVQGPDMGAFWTGPDIWMVEAPYHSHETLAATLKAQLGDCASVTEQSDAWVRFDISGAGLEQVFARLCNLDLERMAAGSARRSVIEHLGCYVIRRADGMHVYGPRSSARSLHHALSSAARAVV